EVWSLDGQILHGYFGSTVLLLLPMLLIGRRWGLPVGMPTALVTLQATLLWLMFGEPGDEWLFVTAAIASAVVELLARIALSRLRGLSADARWMMLGFLAPIMLWGAVLAVGGAVVGVGWGPHVISGVLTFAALTGLGTAFVLRRIQISS
ncbi:MAG: hypothetical protein U1C73_09985, partial [Dietzia sp.]|nr:hypothetical protein [Dietzia sp.]